MDALVDHLNRLGGVGRCSSLQRLGWSRHRSDTAVRAGALRRIRRDWVAVAGADQDLVSAARSGVVLSCVTLAARLGLWVTEVDRPHVAADPHGRGAGSSDVTVHWSRPLVPRHPDALVDATENALVLISTCQPYESALATWESALRRGAVSRTALDRLELPATARALLRDAWDFADSGLETIFRLRLGWLRVPVRSQTWLLGHRVDFLIGRRLVVQIDGGHHVGAQRRRDVEHDALLLLEGYHVIRLTYPQVMDDWPAVQDLIVTAVAVGLHEPR